jgi:hypothetical protein
MQYFQDELVFTKAALNAWPVTTHLTGPCDELGTEWYDVAKKESVARQEVIEASAIVRVLDQSMDLLTREFSGMLLVVVNQNRESTLYRRFFAKAPSKIVRLSISKQAEIIESVFVPAIDDLAEDSPLKPFKERMLKVTADANEAVERLTSARARRKSVSLDMEEWKAKVNSVRMSIFGELIKVASEQQYPRAWAESFYHIRRRYRSKEDKPETAAEEQETNAVERSSATAIEAAAQPSPPEIVAA